MKQVRVISSAFVLFLIWWLLAAMMDNDFIIPYPLDVIRLMLAQLTMSSFYENLIYTLFRSWGGLCVAFIIAGSCAFLAYQFKLFHDLFYPLLLLMRSVPNISFIIVILLWFGSDSSAAIVSFLIIFPTIYANIYSGLNHIDSNLIKVVQLYPKKTSYKIRHVYLPLLGSSIQASLSNGMSLTFKVGVMAEILGQVQIGIGRQMNLCRLTSDMTGVFAWTGWIILILLIMDLLLHLFWKKNEDEKNLLHDKL